MDSFGNKKILNFPGEATLSDAKISFYHKYGLNEEMSILLYNGLKLENNDERKIRTNTYINVYDPKQIYKRKEFGKTLVRNVMIHNFEQKKIIENFKIIIGTLESNSTLYQKIENYLAMRRGIKKLYLNNKEINREDKKSLKNLDIKEDFNAIVEL